MPDQYLYVNEVNSLRSGNSELSISFDLETLKEIQSSSSGDYIQPNTITIISWRQCNSFCKQISCFDLGLLFI